MAGVMRVDLNGFKELNKVLKQLPAELGKKVNAAALRKAGNVIRDEAKQNAPYSPMNRAQKYAGKKKYYQKHLRDSIRVKTLKAEGINVKMQVTVGEAYWGKFSEFGTSRQSAKPWMRPAFENTKTEAITALATELGKGLERTSKKLVGSLAKSGLVRRRRRG